MMRRALPVVVGLLLFAAVAAAQGATLVPLTAAEVPGLLKPPAHGERIIMLWSLDCAYCEPNMQALAKLQRAHPDRVDLITVATDSARQASNITARLKAAGMQRYTARAYAEASPAHLDFLVDPGWGGELPRTIVIRADGSRVAISGELSAQQLQHIAPE